MVIYTFLCIVLLYITICLRCLKLILKKWEFKRLGYFPGQVTFQGLYGYSTRVPSFVRFSSKTRWIVPDLSLSISLSLSLSLSPLSPSLCRLSRFLSHTRAVSHRWQVRRRCMSLVCGIRSGKGAGL